MINVLEHQTQFRKDGIEIKIITAKCYINRETHEFVSVLPEDAVETEWAELSGRVRKDQTGEIYEIAHDVQDASYTYTEVYPSKDSYSEISFANYGTEYRANANYNLYPVYSAYTTYSEGDIVTYDNQEWISEMNDNTGNNPKNGIGWTSYLPYLEKREVEWKTLEELETE